jgi:hypothetical protein
MKYLMLYEAFESNVLSKTVKYIKTKVGKNSANAFLNNLKFIKDQYDLPIDKISDSDIKYLSAKASINIKPESVENKWGVFAIKFWFSVSDGFLGYTGIGNFQYNYTSYSRNRNKIGHFSKTEIDIIKNNLGINKGILSKVENYNDLRSGDKVILYLNYHKNSVDLKIGEIWREDDQLFVLQNSHDGEAPYGDYRSRGYRYGWSIGDVNYPADDHNSLHRYVETDDDLKLDYDDGDSSEDYSIYDFNLPFSGSNLTDWGSGNVSENAIEGADFSIILYLDNILKKDLKKPGEKKLARTAQKSGAVALMDDATIKNTNIDRYFRGIIDKMGISDKGINDLRDLQKIALKSILGKWSFFSIYRQDPDLDRILNMSDYIKNFMKSGDEYYLRTGIDYYKRITDTHRNIMKTYNRSYEEFKNLDKSDDLQKLFDMLLEIGEMITNWVKSLDIKTIGELNICYYKLVTIRRIIIDDNITISNAMLRFVSDFIYEDNEYWVGALSDKDLSDDIKRLENLKVYIQSILTK